MRRMLLLSLFSALALGEGGVVLKSGKFLAGRVVGREKVGKKTMLAVETDFGRMLVESRAVKKQQKDKGDGDDAFRCLRIRVLRVRGTVERKGAGADAWMAVTLTDEYGPKLNKPNAIVKPGDTVRTGDDGTIDLMPHRNAWIRIAPGSLVHLPGAPGPASIEVKQGKTLQRVHGKPRGKTFKVRTAATLCSVSGTEFSTTAKGRVGVKDGKVDTDQGPVAAGEVGTVSGGKLTKTAMSDEEKAEFDDEIHLPPENDMVFIAGGKYPMGGAVKSEVDAPKRTVTLTGYFIDRREVSNAEYAAYAAAMEAPVPAYFDGAVAPKGQEHAAVRNVSWAMAHGFARWCGKELPTEAQWEAAARGTKAAPKPLGESVPAADVRAKTKDVSASGVFAMRSSVFEWCRDWYQERIYTTGPHDDPRGPGTGIWKVVRGQSGSATYRWHRPAKETKSATGIRCVGEPE